MVTYLPGSPEYIQAENRLKKTVVNTKKHELALQANAEMRTEVAEILKTIDTTDAEANLVAPRLKATTSSRRPVWT